MLSRVSSASVRVHMDHAMIAARARSVRATATGLCPQNNVFVPPVCCGGLTAVSTVVLCDTVGLHDYIYLRLHGVRPAARASSSIRTEMELPLTTRHRRAVRASKKPDCDYREIVSARQKGETAV